ncbi:hypothetical protein [Okeania sp. SIO2B9]|nr:hypothetical protein [Okeania sp. SIO2B9]NES92136.1 hypothetical protein [Okeania sp. SIO2B9]
MMQNKHGKSNNSQLKTNHNNYYWEATNEQVNSPSPTISPNLTSGEEDDNGKSQK